MSIPYIPQRSNSQFYVPKTLADDFDTFLNNDIPDTVMNFVLLHNWYDQESDSYEENLIRGEIYPDSTKSRYEDTDNNMNFRASRTSGIKKGDMLIDEKGVIYVLDWEVALQSNNAPSRAVRCNMNLEVTRKLNNPVAKTGEELIDDMGFVIEPSQEEESKEYSSITTIVPSIPCNAYRYDGRPEYSALSNSPGVVPNSLTIITVQYNNCTKNIHIGDNFVWGNQIYEIIDINYVGINLLTGDGTLKLHAKKSAGGMLYE